MSPEAVLVLFYQDAQFNPFKLDIFSFGVTIFEVLVGRRPRWVLDNIRDMDSLQREFQGLVADVNGAFDNGFMAQLLPMLTLTDDQRLTAKELKEINWFIDVSGHEMYQEPAEIRLGFNPRVRSFVNKISRNRSS